MGINTLSVYCFVFFVCFCQLPLSLCPHHSLSLSLIYISLSLVALVLPSSLSLFVYPPLSLSPFLSLAPSTILLSLSLSPYPPLLEVRWRIYLKKSLSFGKTLRVGYFTTSILPLHKRCTTGVCVWHVTELVQMKEHKENVLISIIAVK